MAYGYLKRKMEEGKDIKIFLEEGMLFSAFITLVREAETREELAEIEEEAEKESKIKSRDAINKEELESIQYEIGYYLIYGGLE